MHNSGVIDLGALFYGLFGGGGHTPSLANVSFPNQVPTATPSGGPLGPGNGDPWNEQAPFGGSGSPVGIGGLSGSGPNIGGIFGQGNISPFIFSFADQMQTGDVPIDNPFFAAVVQGVHNAAPVASPQFIAGWYGASAIAATVGYAAYDISLVQKGVLFGTRLGGNTPILNSTRALRIGWSYSKQYGGQYVFRIGGTALGKFLSNPHINLWPPSWWGGPPTP